MGHGIELRMIEAVQNVLGYHRFNLGRRSACPLGYHLRHQHPAPQATRGSTAPHRTADSYSPNSLVVNARSTMRFMKEPSQGMPTPPGAPNALQTEPDPVGAGRAAADTGTTETVRAASFATTATPGTAPASANGTELATTTRIVFAVTALASAMTGLDMSIVNVAFADLRADHPGTSQASLAWVITAYSIVVGSLLVTGGRTADRLGRKRAFLGGIAVFATGALLSGLAPNVGLLIAARALQAAGAAFLIPTSVALLIGAYPPQRRTQIMTLWAGVGALAVATGPSLGAGLVSIGGWRWAFLINVPVGAAAALIGYRVLRETEPSPQRHRPDYLGVGLITVALGALVLALSRGNEWGWLSPSVLVAMAAAIIGGAWLIARSRRHPEPAVDLTLFNNRGFTIANIGTLAYAMGFFPLLLGNVLFLTNVWGYSILRAGLAVTPGPVVVALVAGSAGKAASRFGFRPVIAAGATSLVIGLSWYIAFVEPTPNFLGAWLPGAVIFGFGVALTFPVLTAAAVASLPPERYAAGTAINQTARQVGGAVGVTLLVLILGEAATMTHYRHMWLYCAAMAATAGAIGAFIPRPGPAARP